VRGGLTNNDRQKKKSTLDADLKKNELEKTLIGREVGPVIRKSNMKGIKVYWLGLNKNGVDYIQVK